MPLRLPCCISDAGIWHVFPPRDKTFLEQTHSRTTGNPMRRKRPLHFGRVWLEWWVADTDWTRSVAACAFCQAPALPPPAMLAPACTFLLGDVSFSSGSRQAWNSSSACLHSHILHTCLPSAHLTPTCLLPVPACTAAPLSPAK